MQLSFFGLHSNIKCINVFHAVQLGLSKQNFQENGKERRKFSENVRLFFQKMSDSDGFGNIDLNFGEVGNYQSIMNNPDISPNSKFDKSFTFDSDESGSSTGPPPMRPKSPKGNYKDMKFQAPTPPRSNSPEDTEGSAELTALFALISNFEPNPVELTVHWKPFLPDLQPAIGAIDAFIKVPRPDTELDELGLVILDEPSISQSNPQILRMELREQYGLSSPENQCDAYIGLIEDPRKNSKELTSWLESIEEIHRQRPPPSFIYSSKMPEFEALMEPWPDKFEDALKSLVLPSCELNLSFDEYARVICAILEIPVKDNIVESLHHLFSLFAEFEGNQHFQTLK